MSCPDLVLELVDRFSRNREVYTSGHYNEASLRNDFVNPFFDALGWDVYNKSGADERFKDVVLEEGIKVGSATKRPDYTFRVGPTPIFFVEAKKPSVNIKSDSESAYQLRRYAWSAKLPLSILTDFEEFAVYDCRVKPHKNDKASTARIMYLTYDKYPGEWEKIESIFSPESIKKGSFDKYAQSRRKRGTAEVDAAFLKEIEHWRVILAQNIALRNKGLSRRDINHAVQRTIDRIIFLRICEDRGIEQNNRLQGLLGAPRIYPRLVEFFYRADERYNSGLFHFQKEKGRATPPDDLTPGLEIDDKVLKDIIKNLYYPDSPYEFSVLPADILGQVYEQFLGKVIRLTPSHRAVVEDKPEVKKAGGVYYTPTYIVDYIVKNTVGKLLDGKTPKQAQKLRILDPACGSGSFLIGAYQYLLDWHLERYTEKDPKKHAKARSPKVYQAQGGDWRLTPSERKQILLKNIYGIDIDPQAVEVTKLSLLLKVLEGESEETVTRQLRFSHERALPDLSGNIKCGNSLIGTDFYEGKTPDMFDDEERYRVNPFDWDTGFPEIFKGKNPGFDAVIGNPPYDVLEKERGKASWPHDTLSEYVKVQQDYGHALGGKLNLFRFFVIRSLALTRNGGRYGMILPLALLGDISCATTRRHLLRNTVEVTADCFPQKDNRNRRVFFNAKLSTLVLNATGAVKGSHDPKLLVRTYPWNSFKDSCLQCVVRLEKTCLLDPDNTPIPLVDENSWSLCKKIHKAPGVVRLGTCCFFSLRRGEINQTIYRRFISDDPQLARLVKGVEIGRFVINEKLSQGKHEWFDEQAFLKGNTPKPFVSKSRIATQRITGVDERLRIVATMIEPPAYFADSTNSVAMAEESLYALEYLLGLLNSNLFQWRFKLTSTNNNVATNELKSLPFRTIDFSYPADKSRHDRMVELVDVMLKLHKDLAKAKTEHDKTLLQRQIDATDKQLDKLVYELYGLTEEEIGIVEEGTC